MGIASLRKASRSTAVVLGVLASAAVIAAAQKRSVPGAPEVIPGQFIVESC